MAEVVIATALLSAVVKALFDKMASRKFIDFLKGRKRSENLVEKLKTTMNSVEVLLGDAEEQQITKPAVKRWLYDLLDAFYQADDLVDKIDYKALQLQFETRCQATIHQMQKVSSRLNPFKEGMDTKLEEILERLEHLLEQKDRLGLREGVGGQPLLLSQSRVPTTSLLEKSGFYGRDDDVEHVKELVLRESNGVDVICIVGMGGIGKTTLAQHVYNDSRLQGFFDLKAWVCISLKFNVFRITEDILKEFGLMTCDTLTPNQLHLELEKKVKEKKFLLVLDDVWNERYEGWDNLRKPLLYGAPGSKIVVTTCNASVASIMGTVTIYCLKELEDDDCLSLFVERAFGDENPSAHPELLEIGRQIVRKCKGLPLAAKVLGDLLRPVRVVEKWRTILESNLWDLSVDNIPPALMLSYYYLPSHLKLCLSYCAIFPQDYAFREEEVILLWMAEGLIVQPEGNKEIEEVAHEYFHDLVSRSFFHQQLSDKRVVFVMHDVINNLAKSVSGEFCCRLETDSQVNNGERIRHLSFTKTDHGALEKLKAIKPAKFLRTFLPIDVRGWQWQNTSCCIDNKVLLDLLPTLCCLRTLSLSGYHNISLVPDSVGRLKHLRYLNLKGALIKKLPDHVTSLYFLQTLILSGCENLIKLPVGMARLINLCHLDITGTKLQEMPPQMGKLTRLQCLTDFFLGNNSGSNIKELGGLKHLRGGLRIWNLQHVENDADASEANLKGKKHIQKLELKWNGDTKGSVNDKAVLDKLKPHTNLEVLAIDGYGGTEFPAWVGDSSFSNVVSLFLRGCKHCSSLPSFGQLASLKHLGIEAFEAAEVIGPEFYGSNTSVNKPFGSLETLWFKGCQNGRNGFIRMIPGS